MSSICHCAFKRHAAVLAVCLGLSLAATGQGYNNRITFSNMSGDDALVKVVGPETEIVSVPNGGSGAVRVPAGQYYILVRYCDRSQRCSYTRGNPFSVDETLNQYSDITITLHKVVNGNYGTRPSSGAEFMSH